MLLASIAPFFRHGCLPSCQDVARTLLACKAGKSLPSSFSSIADVLARNDPLDRTCPHRSILLADTFHAAHSCFAPLPLPSSLLLPVGIPASRRHRPRCP